MQLTIDPNSTEVVFAQKLAANEPTTRRRAVNKLRQWMTNRIETNNLFSKEDLLKLWKGLYYCMWMQDKPLLQEELADDLTELTSCFHGNAEQVMLNFEVFFETITREWPGVDKWRMDKFLMFQRRYFRRSLHWLAIERKWSPKLTTRMIQLYNRLFIADPQKRTKISPEQPRKKMKEIESQNDHSSSDVDDYVCPDGIRSHFTAMYLDELDLAAQQSSGQKKKLTEDVVMQFLQPFVDVLGQKINHIIFESVRKEIFDTILLQFSDELQRKAEEAEDEENEESDEEEEEEEKPDEGQKNENGSTEKKEPDGLEFNYNAIGDALFLVSSERGLTGHRRKVINDLIRKFRSAATGSDPMDDELDSDGGSDVDMRKEIEQAAKRLLRRSVSGKGKKRKRRAGPGAEEDVEDVALSAIPSSIEKGKADSDDEGGGAGSNKRRKKKNKNKFDPPQKKGKASAAAKGKSKARGKHRKKKP